MEEFYEPKWWQKAIWWVRGKFTWRNEKAELRSVIATRDRTINMMNAIVDDQTTNLKALLGQLEAAEAKLAENKDVEAMRVKLREADDLVQSLLDDCIDADFEIADLIKALEMIAAEEKPNSSGAAKRMAEMARQARDLSVERYA
jgi:hypothetical protein